jgi:hypothetical protein
MKTFQEKDSGFVNYVTESGDVYGFMSLQPMDESKMGQYQSFQSAGCDMDEVWEGEWVEVTA